MKKTNKMTLADLLAMTFTEATNDHMHDLRERLHALGLISTIEQKYLYTEEAKREALKWYTEQMAKEAEKGSTGWRGKLFEVKTRIEWSIIHGTPYAVNDVKCRPNGLADMRVKIDGANVEIELKTGTGALVNGPDFATCIADLNAMVKRNPLVVWLWDDEGEPMALRFNDLMKGLEEYNGGIDTWLLFDDGAKRKDGQHAIRFQNYHSKKKMEHLEKVAFDGYDWQTIMETASFE
ncbi:MAG: hypothetical protein IKW44_04465 [Bacteroidaceae bacterium]|nr:hypothetical protein [Bacteroidaceae bacterium]